MNKVYNPKLIKNAQILRKNMTKEERQLWYNFLKGLQVTVNRQKVIGKYIADFYIASSKIVIELDRFHHFEDDGIIKDCNRDDYLKELGFKVLRYSNLDTNQKFDEVCQYILNNINTSSDG